MGTPKSSFDYTLSISNDSGKDLTVALSAQAARPAPRSEQIELIPI